MRRCSYFGVVSSFFCVVLSHRVNLSSSSCFFFLVLAAGALMYVSFAEQVLKLPFVCVSCACSHTRHMPLPPPTLRSQFVFRRLGETEPVSDACAVWCRALRDASLGGCGACRGRSRVFFRTDVRTRRGQWATHASGLFVCCSICGIWMVTSTCGVVGGKFVTSACVHDRAERFPCDQGSAETDKWPCHCVRVRFWSWNHHRWLVLACRV